MNKVIKILSFLLFVSNICISQVSDLSFYKNKESVFINSPLIINETFLYNLVKIELKDSIKNQTDKKHLLICKYLDRNEKINQVLLLEVNTNNYNFIAWDNNLNDWYSVATFYNNPTLVDNNIACIFDGIGNFCQFNSSWTPLTPNCNFNVSSSNSNSNFELIDHVYNSKMDSNFKMEGDFSILNRFKNTFSEVLKPKQIINGSLIPLDFLFHFGKDADGLFYVNHIMHKNKCHILAFKKIESECNVSYIFYSIEVVSNEIVMKKEIGKINYLKNKLYFYNIDLNVILKSF